MRTLLPAALALVLVSQIGCISQVTSRLDETNAKLDRLITEMQETNRRLAVVEASTSKVAKALP